MKCLNKFVVISFSLLLVNNFAYSMKSDRYSDYPWRQVNNYSIGSIDASAIELMKQILDRRSPPTISDETQKKIQDFFSILYDNKGAITLTTVTGLFLYPLYRTRKINNYIKKENLWLSWKKDLPLEEFLKLPIDEFSKDLLEEVEKRHANSRSKSLNLEKQFKKNIQKEINELESYLNLIKNFDFFGILTSFANENLTLTIEGKLLKLEYIDKIFSDKISYKLKLRIIDSVK